MKTTRFIVAAALAMLLATPALAGDIIVLKSGRKYGNAKASDPPAEGDYADSNITVTEENLDKVVFVIDGVPTPQDVKADDVDAVYHDPSLTPGGLLRGMRLLESNQFEDAYAAFDEVAADSRAPKWAQAEAAYRMGEAVWYSGALSDAAKTFDAFLGKWKKSKFVPGATKANARIKLTNGDVKGARTAFQSLKKLPGLPEVEKLEVDYWITWIDEQVAAQAKDNAGLESALKGYQTLSVSLKGRKGMEDLRGKCQVGEASCVVALGRFAEAQQITTKLVETNDDPLVRAGAYTLLGRAIVLQSAGTADADKNKEALLHFLRVITLYGNTPGAEDWMAESLYRAGMMFDELRPPQAKTDEDKAAARMARARARREWNECVTRYPRSQWATKARAKLN
jgi:tetratricopeptide (TPR) repeat protein